MIDIIVSATFNLKTSDGKCLPSSVYIYRNFVLILSEKSDNCTVIAKSRGDSGKLELGGNYSFQAYSPGYRNAYATFTQKYQKTTVDAVLEPA